MALTVHVQGLDGLGIIPPTNPEFDALASPLLGRISDVALKLKPMLILVSNESEETVVSFSKTWHVVHGDGRTSTFRDHTSFPLAVCGDVLGRQHADGLAPGSSRIEAHGVVIHGWKDLDQYFDQFLPQFVAQKERVLADAVTLRIDLNAAIFADGTLVGPDDESWLEQLFATYVGAKQTWYSEIIAAFDGGQSVQDAFASVERFLQKSRDWTPLGESPLPAHSLDHWARTGAAAEATRWRRHYADDQIPRLLREAIRVEPFVIRRRSIDPQGGRV
jgi:hypothetical protein